MIKMELSIRIYHISHDLKLVDMFCDATMMICNHAFVLLIYTHAYYMSDFGWYYRSALLKTTFVLCELDINHISLVFAYDPVNQLIPVLINHFFGETNHIWINLVVSILKSPLSLGLFASRIKQSSKVFLGLHFHIEYHVFGVKIYVSHHQNLKPLILNWLQTWRMTSCLERQHSCNLQCKYNEVHAFIEE